MSARTNVTVIAAIVASIHQVRHGDFHWLFGLLRLNIRPQVAHTTTSMEKWPSGRATLGMPVRLPRTREPSGGVRVTLQATPVRQVRMARRSNVSNRYGPTRRPST